MARGSDMQEVLCYGLSSEPVAEWGDWFGSFATAAAAKRYLTMHFTGPKVPDRDSFPGWGYRLGPDHRWQVRVAYLSTEGK